jgi:hypothetical protein
MYSIKTLLKIHTLISVYLPLLINAAYLILCPLYEAQRNFFFLSFNKVFK